MCIKSDACFVLFPFAALLIYKSKSLLCLLCSELQRLKLEIYANPDLELDDRVKKLRQLNYKNDYRQRCHSDKVGSRIT